MSLGYYINSSAFKHSSILRKWHACSRKRGWKIIFDHFLVAIWECVTTCFCRTWRTTLFLEALEYCSKLGSPGIFGNLKWSHFLVCHVDGWDCEDCNDLQFIFWCNSGVWFWFTKPFIVWVYHSQDFIDWMKAEWTVLFEEHESWTDSSSTGTTVY